MESSFLFSTIHLDIIFPQCKEGGFPQELWLGVSADAVSVYKRGEGRPLEIFQYEHILSFGAPLANVYKIVVDERELLFGTVEVRKELVIQFCFPCF